VCVAGGKCRRAKRHDHDAPLELDPLHHPVVHRQSPGRARWILEQRQRGGQAEREGAERVPCRRMEQGGAFLPPPERRLGTDPLAVHQLAGPHLGDLSGGELGHVERAVESHRQRGRGHPPSGWREGPRVHGEPVCREEVREGAFLGPRHLTAEQQLARGPARFGWNAGRARGEQHARLLEQLARGRRRCRPPRKRASARHSPAGARRRPRRRGRRGRRRTLPRIAAARRAGPRTPRARNRRSGGAPPSRRAAQRPEVRLPSRLPCA